MLLAPVAPAPAVAAPSLTELESELHTVHVNLVADQAKAKTLQQATDASQAQLDEVNGQIGATQQQISATQKSIVHTENEIGTWQRRLKATRAKMDAQMKGLDAVLLYTQQYGPVGFLDVLLRVASFREFVSRASQVAEITTYEREIFDRLDRYAREVHQDLTSLAATKAKLDRQQQTLVAQRASLAATAKQRADVLDQLHEEQSQVAAIEADLQKQGQTLWDAIEQINAELADGQLTSSQLFSLVQSISAVYGIDPLLVMAVIQEESGGNTKAISSAGAKGLMQLMPGTASELGVTDPFNPQQNVHGGIAYLAYLIKLFNGNIRYALAAYNAGPNAVKEYGGIPPYPETENYVNNIMYMYEHGI